MCDLRIINIIQSKENLAIGITVSFAKPLFGEYFRRCLSKLKKKKNIAKSFVALLLVFQKTGCTDKPKSGHRSFKNERLK